MWTLSQLQSNPTGDPGIAVANQAYFPAFLGFFLLVFGATGVGNGSTYKMIPAIFRAEAERATTPATRERAVALVEATRQSSAAIGFIGAVGAIGGFLIPVTFSAPWVANPLAATRSAFVIFTVFYVGCALVTWAVYLRRPLGARAEAGYAGAGI
jgi:NNP family nitrate/nitrite transporter-like MFS transporter